MGYNTISMKQSTKDVAKAAKEATGFGWDRLVLEAIAQMDLDDRILDENMDQEEMVQKAAEIHGFDPREIEGLLSLTAEVDPDERATS